MSTAHPTRVRVALVTGAAQGIGRAIALRLAADGLDVGVADLPAKLDALNGLVEEIEALGRKAHPIATDVSKEAEVQAMVDATVSESALGRLDVSQMVANAGVGSRAASILDADFADWERIWDVNIRGVIFCYKHAARQMVKQGDGGRIIGASSICGLRGFAGKGGYCISKAAVRSQTQTVALELRTHRITVNAYAPGLIETEMTKSEADKLHSEGRGSALKQ
ncbi:short chain oxidoreductase, partial [Mycena pura]